jgi:MarR family transcriptional regulator, organic hydroperoxide resistance regulator
LSTEARSLDGATEVGQAFKRTVAALRRLRGRETRCPGELSDAQYGLLFGLVGHGQLSAGELAELADVSPASATEMLEALDVAGLVHRHRSETDRRVVLSSLTDRGLELVEERRARYEPLWRAALAEFSEEQLLSAAAVLDRLRAMFDDVAENGHVSRS